MTTLISRARSFAYDHDEIPAFHAAYLVGTFLIAAVLNLGFFALLIVAHMCLDFVKYREYHGFSYRDTLRAMILESLSDICLLSVATVFAVYVNHTFGLAAVGGLARAQLTIIKAAGMLVPKIHILEHALIVFVNVRAYLVSAPINIKAALTHSQKWQAFITIASLTLIAIAFTVFSEHRSALLAILSREFSLSF